MLFSSPEIPAHTRAAAQRLAAAGRIPQSVLLTGGAEKLRAAAAKELAMAVLCSASPEKAPCGKCSNCIKAKAGSHPDLITILPAADKKTVSITTVQTRVLGELWVAPNEAENKVYLFPDADELSPVIQNALLKTIEEPPPFVMLLLTADRRESLLDTVVSRCTEFFLGDTGAQNRKKEAETAADAAAGLARAFVTGSAYEIMIKTAPMLKNRALMKKTAEALTLIARDAMVADSGVAAISGFPQEAALLNERCGMQTLLGIRDAMEEIRRMAESNANENLLASRFSASLAALAKKNNRKG